MTAPKAFISYSHDSQEHKSWVLDLATRLRNSGIDAILDQWELTAGDDVPHFMETNLASADRVLMICTERYVEKANTGSGGVGYEKMIVTSDLMSRIDSNKVIPIIRQDASTEVPTFLKTKMYINFSKPDDYELSIDDLVRSIHGTPLFKKPEIGNSPFKPIEETRPEKNNDIAMDILKALISSYERGEDFTDPKDIYTRSGISRILFEIHLNTLIEQGYVVQSKMGNLFLQDKGKQYAITHGLVS